MNPRQPAPLPDDLPSTFTIPAARDVDVSAKRLRSSDLDTRVYGVRAPAGSADDRVLRARMFAARLTPVAFFSHSTAAILHGFPLPPRFERMTRLHATVEAPQRAPHASGLIGHSRRVVEGDVQVRIDGLRIGSPERTVCEMAGVLPLPDLVAIVDHMINRTAPVSSLDALSRRIAVGDRVGRSARIRSALELADENSESPPESRLRVICVLAGLPRPAANHPVEEPSSGRRFRLDLAWPEQMFAVEYHGDYHRDVAQWRRDVTRKSLIEALGWRILELTAADLADEAMLVSRIRAGLHARTHSR